MSADNIVVCPKGRGENAYAVNTLREYIDAGIDEDGTFSISFEAECNNCGFEFEYN